MKIASISSAESGAVESYRQKVRERALDANTFVELTMKGPVRGPEVPWRKVTVRPVLIKGRRHLQFSMFDEKRDLSKNFEGEDAASRLDEVLAIPFSSISVRTTDSRLQVQVTKKGKVILHEDRGEGRVPDAPVLAHDRAKNVPLPARGDDDFLSKTGIVNGDGEVRPHMRGKYTQINEFLQLLEHTGELERIESRPMRIIDCGCGSAYLTFAAYHYLNHVRGIPTAVTGIDSNRGLIEKCSRQRDELGYEAARFVASPIVGYEPEDRPDIVLALHACDTATDDALGQAVRWGARVILAVPCCHHDLNRQLKNAGPLAPVMRHGILKQRMGDILTDSFRALILRLMGYRTDVIEFVSTEHTAKNLMIRAVASAPPGDPALAEEYRRLKEFWGVAPYLEKLLGEDLARHLG